MLSSYIIRHIERFFREAERRSYLEKSSTEGERYSIYGGPTRQLSVYQTLEEIRKLRQENKSYRQKYDELKEKLK